MEYNTQATNLTIEGSHIKKIHQKEKKSKKRFSSGFRQRGVNKKDIPYY